MNKETPLGTSRTLEKSNPSKPIPRNGIGYKMMRGGAIGKRLVRVTRIKEQKPRTKQAPMNRAENNNQLENDSFRLS